MLAHASRQPGSWLTWDVRQIPTIPKSVIILFAVLLPTVFAAAADSNALPARKESPITNTLYLREFTLSPDAPEDTTVGVVLDGVLPNRSAKIRIKATGEVITVREGNYCVCSLFGERGLEVKSVDLEKGVVTFVHRWCE